MNNTRPQFDRIAQSMRRQVSKNGAITFTASVTSCPSKVILLVAGLDPVMID